MRFALTWMSAMMLCGCLGQAKPDILQARLREQQRYVMEVEQKMETAQADLKRAARALVWRANRFTSRPTAMKFTPC